MVKRVSDLARDHVGLVGVGQGDDDVGIAGTGAFQYVGIGRVPYDGANVESVLQLTQYFGAHVDNGDLVGLFAGQVISR